MATDRSYAIVESGGKQYRAEKGANLLVEHLPADQGEKVTLRAVMYRGDKDVVVEAGELEKVKVEAVVAEHLRGPKVRIFKYKPKKGYRRRSGHRQELTRLEVTDVRLLTRRPAGAKRRAASEKQGEAADKAAAKPRTRTKKPASKRPAAKRPAARKPAPKKPATGGKARSSGRSSAARRSSSAKKD